MLSKITKGGDDSGISNGLRAKWEVPEFKISLWLGRQHNYCVVIPVINEGDNLINLLIRMNELNIQQIADIIIIDGGSDDGSIQIEKFQSYGIRGVLVKTGYGKLSAQLRCAYAFVLDKGYDGVITIDGNNKDDPEAIPRFIDGLKRGFDFIQASRFLKGGLQKNTPIFRYLSIRFIHAPILSLFSGFGWTDTTQGFRGYSNKLLLDDRLAPFRKIFISYELLAYLSYRAPKLGYRCIELPTNRCYPDGSVPTKIRGYKGNLSIFKILLFACSGMYNR